MHPDHLLEELSWRQLLEWEAYAGLEPFGEWRGDLRVAQLTSLLANVHRNPDKKREPFTWRDFMPFDEMQIDDVKQPVQKQSIEEMRAVLVAIASAHKPKQRKAPSTRKRKPR